MPKIYHAVTKYATVTFLSLEDQEDWLGEGEPPADCVLCESEVTDEEYGKLERWREEA